MANPRLIAAAIGLPLLLGGCTIDVAGVALTFGGHQPVAAPPKPALPCEGLGPIYTHQGDVITDATGREIILVNKSGAKICGWQKPSRGTP